MSRPRTPDEEDPKAKMDAEATFIAPVGAAGTVSDGETLLQPQARDIAVPNDTVENIANPTTSSHSSASQSPGSAGSSTTSGSLVVDSSSEWIEEKTNPLTEATFISSPDQSPLGATVVGVPSKDSEDFFETLQGRSLESSGADARGHIVGDYQIIGELGRGGMGVVYKAKHRKLNRIVALKMILTGKHSGNEALERFVAEARAVAKLQHPGIVQIFDIGEHESLPYFSLEYVDGTDLSKDLKGLPRDPKRSAEMVEKLCHAMQYAHDNKILHRDLKPANILLDKNGVPKISDFGLAKSVDADEAGATTDGTIMGSPSYMPPEQARGQNSSITPRSDLYSLGAILYQMLTARPPFVAERALETVMLVINNEPVAPRDLQPGLPVDLETICMKALQKDPAARYASCSELAADLRRFINGEPILARPIGRLERAVRWCKRNPRVAIPSGLAGLFIFATAIISTWAWNSSAAAAVALRQERDNVQEQKDEADRQRAIANVNEQKAVKEKEEADRQKLLADEAKLQAEKNQKLAEDQAMLALKNIQLIVTEVDDRLAKEPGMSEIRVSLLQIVEREWDKLDLSLVGGLKGQAVPTLMTVRFKIADAWVSLDRLQEANATFEKIYQMGQERLLIKNRNDATRYNMAMICLRWAPVKQRLTGDPADSNTLLQEGLSFLRDILAHPLPSDDPASPSPARYEVSSVLQQTLMQLASSQKKQGDLIAASASFEELGEHAADILKEIADNADWFAKLTDDRRALVRSYFSQNLNISKGGRANILCTVGKVDEAIPLYKAVIDAARADLLTNPKDRNSRDQLFRQLTNFGQYMVRTERFDEGAAALAEANVLAEALYTEDPGNAQAKRNFGVTQYYLGTARDAQGLAPDALVLFERSRVIRSELVANSPDKPNKVDLMLSEARLGNAEAARALITDLSGSEAKDPELRIDLARSLAQLARAAAEDAREPLVAQAIQNLQRAIDEGLIDPFPVANEPDLLPLREDPRFQSIVQTLQQKREQTTPK